MEERSLSRVDLIVEGKAYVEGRFIECAIGIDEGIIASITKPSIAPRAEHKVIAKGNELIVPGMVDMHVHMRGLEESYKEDWLTGTMSALRGGVTFICDMPNNKPFINSISRLKMKLDEARANALVDYGFYLGFPEDLNELRQVKGLGVYGVKLYPDDYRSARLYKLLRVCAEEGLLVVFHAEDPDIVDSAMRLHKVRKVEKHHELRPEAAEHEAVRKLLLALSEVQGVRAHFTHLSLVESIRQVIYGKMQGLSVTCDTCPHYMLLDASLLTKLKGIAKVNPPLRPHSYVREVFNSVKGMIVDAISTDHAPHLLEEKLRSSYDEIPPGFPGLEVCLPLLMTLIDKGDLPLQCIDLYSKGPARILGLGKGSISIGFDGDLVIVRKEKWTIRGNELASKAKFTPFEGWELKWKVVKVLIRGVLALDEGEVKVGKGYGRLIKPLDRA